MTSPDQKYWNKVSWLFLALLTLVVALGLTVGCGTVTPKQVESKSASFDGNTNSSGWLGFSTGRACDAPVSLKPPSKDGWPWGVITLNARARYNVLVKRYGNNSEFLIPLKPDDGIYPRCENFSIDREHLEYFGVMNQWFKQGK